MRKHMAKPFMKTAGPGVPGLQWMSIGHPEDDETMSILTFRDQDKNEFRAAVSDLSIAQLIAGLINQRTDDDTTELRAIQGSVVEKGPYLKLNFKADAREADMRLLLVEVQGSLAAGPGQLGDYYVRVPESQLQGITEKVRASPIVDGVAVVDALPARP